MNSIICWKRELQAAALGAVVLLSACQSGGLPPQPGTGSRPNVASGQLTVQRARGWLAGPAYQPSGAAIPIPLGTPLPNYFGIAKKAGKFSPRAGAAYLYIADQSSNQIDIFPFRGQRGPQVGTITAGIDGPYGLWFDRRAQELYVANQVNNTVTVYSHGSVQPSRTYSQDLSRPLYPIVDSHGELYVGNANNGTVVEYLAGSTNVYQVLQTPGGEADGMALDKHENLYVAYRNSGQGSIVEYAPGSTQGQIIGMTLDQPQGVVVDPKGNVVATETGSTNRIDVFPPGSTTESLEVPMPSGSVATELAIDCQENALFVSGLYSGIVFGANYPLPGQSLFVKDTVSAIIQGTTIDYNQNF
jgi:DNA-binding beta-propeller fold protein YncE